MSALTGLSRSFDIDPWAYSQLPVNLQLGAVGYDRLGNKYKFVKAGAVALVKANVIQSPASVANHKGMAVQTAVAIGDKQMYVTLGATATTANQYDGGRLIVDTGTGIGTQFTIKSHSVTAASGTALFKFEEASDVVIPTSATVTIIPSMYNGVIQSPTTRSGATVGIAIAPIPAGYFGWLGVEGLFGVLCDATVGAIGDGISPSTTTAGTITKNVTLLDNIGTFLTAGVSAKAHPQFIKIG